MLTIACSKNNQNIEVEYRINNSTAMTAIGFRNEKGLLINDSLDFASNQDIWQYNMQLKRGEIVYLSAIYHDSSSSVNVEILMDGKIYKQKTSVQEPEKYVIVSGIVPYE